ncbi:MAG TPA: AEC family transporter [Cellvibrionaceae bacterium]
MISDLFAVMAPTLVGTLLGWIWAKKSIAFPAEFVSKMVMNIGTPCLFISVMSKVHVSVDAMGKMAFAFALALVFMALISSVIIRLMRLDMRAYLPALIFPNNGNMGLPICLFAIGQEGLALALAPFMVMVLAQFTLGLFIVAPKESNNWQRCWTIIKHPIIISMLICVLLLTQHWTLPLWIRNTVDVMGGFAIPLMMIMLGVSLARFRLTLWPKTLFFSLLRVIGGAAIGVLVCQWLNIVGNAAVVIILQMAMPMAVMNYVLALEYDRKADEVAAMVLMSTLVGFAFLPFLIFWLRLN